MPEVQDIFVKYGTSYRKNHKLPLHISKAMSSIQDCRTSALGGHVEVCEECGTTDISYNSCRNRHCPKCQTLTKERWIHQQKSNLLNVKYFHVVFTIPDALNSIAFQNQKIVYDILFKAAAETLTELALDKKYLGATLGFTSILHTWGQNLMHHPHIHCIIPGGGLNNLGKWVHSRKKFFMPVKVLSRKFRGKFLYYFKKANLEFHGQQRYLSDPLDFNAFLTPLYQKEWVVYCKSPFKDAAGIVEYLGRYTHRVAISNRRILSLENGQIRFKWRDYRDNSKWKVMTISAEEFIRRFLIHILPPRFMKIRHYGFLGNRNKATKLKVCKELTHTPTIPEAIISTIQLIQRITGKDISKCRCCGSDKLSRYSYFGKSPPAISQIA
ncbi:IS91 family transposase [Phosphitispora fastidiosa]|uniref:IS91 family transposase n=1 Tax=Phosphitispora fastidiosa TaxID=2837202 RepID=UPI001E4D827A|nr:IS91 family transposase [Phosphitispora fastidiosa]MBU7006050.1 hypothetical protein [Phosphitispora fastidiosa]